MLYLCQDMPHGQYMGHRNVLGGQVKFFFIKGLHRCHMLVKKLFDRPLRSAFVSTRMSADINRHWQSTWTCALHFASENE